MKKLPIGRENLKDIIEKDFYYVDKTKIIEEILDRGAYVTLFPRPRRFGKSLMISAIEEFFDVEKAETNKNLFDELYISKTKYKEMQGKYPIIKLNLKKIQSNNWNDMYLKIQEEIRQLFESKRYVLDVLEEEEKKLFNKFLESDANIAQYEQSITVLSQYLERYYNQKPILLIDEYDVPIQNGYMHGFYEEIVGFIRGLFNNSLKANNSIEFAVMTGVLRVSKESIFSDLNNVEVYSLIDKRYNEYFGFTEEETKTLLKHYNLELTPEVKSMYDGYIFGEQEIYNPWSIINYANREELLPYWVNTSGDELLKDIFNKTQEETSQMLNDLILGKSIEVKYNEKVTFLDLNSIKSEYAQEIVANFLLVSGYLTKANKLPLKLNREISLKIPNEEVKTVFTEVIRNWITIKSKLQSTKFGELKRVILQNNRERFEEIINEALNHMSFIDSHENFYHGYILGLFVEFLGNEYIVKSNREGGKGRFDIMIEAIDRKTGIIVEFKVAKEDEDIMQKAEKGKSQIKEKEYYKELELDKVENIINYCIVFKGKECVVV